MPARDDAFVDAARVRHRLREAYACLVADPGRGRPFRHGIEYAVHHLRYDRSALAALPASATARFAGVGNPLRMRAVRHGDVVLDLGCGAGVDLLLAASGVGPEGRVIGLDMTPEMCAEARQNGRRAGLEDRVEVHVGEMERLPLPDASVDVVLANGVLNQTPLKERALAEIARVLRPGGHLQLADVFVDGVLPPRAVEDEHLWAT